MQLSVVVLPAPLAPSRHTTLPAPDRRARRSRARGRAVAGRDALQLKHCGLAQIGFDHPGSLRTSRRRALGDLLAEAQHGDAIGNTHHELHHVLDQHDGEALVAYQVDQQGVERRDLLAAQSGRRLVEQEQARPDGQRARQIEHLLPPKSSCLGARVAQWPASPRRSSSASASVDRRGVRPPRAPARARTGSTGGMRGVMPTSRFSRHGQAAAEFDVLEGARDADAPQSRGPAGRAASGPRTGCRPRSA